MDISSISFNNTYDATRTAAESAAMQARLAEVQRQAAPHRAGHVVAEKATSQQDKALKEACQGFETMFLEIMYRQMRKTVPESELFGKKSNAMGIFEDMRDSELMKQVATSGGLGLGDLLYKQLAPTVLASDGK